MSTLSSVQNAHADFEAAHHNFVAEIKSGIKAGLEQAFEDPGVESVAFGVACRPYNDESAGQGIYGPVVNFITYDDDIDPQDVWDNYEFESDDEYALFYDRPAPDRRAQLLSEVLKLADWKYAGEALGVSYWEDEGHGNDEAFIAFRKSDGGYDLQQFEVGY